MSLRSYAVVNGRPTLWGDGLIAVVRKSGIAKHVTSGSDEAKGWCESERTDTGETMRREFTIAQAKRAGLTNKKGPWQEYPDVMMERRAISLCLTRLYADVLGGLVSQDEAFDDGPLPPQDITPPRPQRPAELPEPPAEAETASQDGEGEATQAAETSAEQDSPAEETAAGEAPVSVVEDFLLSLEDRLGKALTEEVVEAAFENFNVQGNLSGDDDALTRAFTIKSDRIKAIRRQAAIDAGQTDLLGGA
jgi:hypothetical protein